MPVSFRPEDSHGSLSVCAPRLLVTARALRAAPPALAGPQGDGAGAVHLVDAVSVSPGQIRLEAMKVEMALLADLTTYHLPVQVQPQDGSLRVQGEVPDEKCHQRVLEVARQACFLP